MATVTTALAVALGRGATATAAAQGPEYVLIDVTAAAGVANADHVHFGCTWSDYNGDGWIDLYSANADENTLYRNNGDGTFTDVTEETGTGDPYVAMRNVWADYDRDGDLDFYSHNFNVSTLYQNNGNVFTDVNRESGAGLLMPLGTGAAWGDYDRDGWLDLHATGVTGWNVLLHNNGDGTFTDLQEEAGLTFDASAMGNMWADVDNDGLLDLAAAAVPADDDYDFLYHNDGDGCFTPMTASAGIVLEEGSSTAAVIFADYDNDGRLDLMLTEVELRSAKILPNRYYLFRNLGGGTFTDVTDAVGITAPVAGDGEDEYEFWDAGFADYDSDGDVDLYIGVKHGENLFYRNNGDGTFTEIGAELGVNYPGHGHGMCWGDYDNDGDIDVYVQQKNNNDGTEPNILLNNTGGSNNWLQLELRGTVSNPDAIGARVNVRTTDIPIQVQELAGGVGFFDQNSPILHFGLGKATTATVTIRWPNGDVQEPFEVEANQRLLIIEPPEKPECPWDLDGDNTVGTPDLLSMLGAWGDPYDTADMIALLGDWGPCK